MQLASSRDNARMGQQRYYTFVAKTSLDDASAGPLNQCTGVWRDDAVTSTRVVLSIALAISDTLPSIRFVVIPAKHVDFPRATPRRVRLEVPNRLKRLMKFLPQLIDPFAFKTLDQ